MDRFLKRITPVVLLLMALLVFFERVLPGSDAIARLVGSDGVVRFVVGVLCIYVMLLVIERQSLDARFTQVLQTFKDFYAARTGTATSEQQTDERIEQARKEALPILVAALESQDPKVRQTALDNLRRLTGKDLGMDPAAWRQHLEQPEKQEEGD